METLVHTILNKDVLEQPGMQPVVRPVPEGWTGATLGELCNKPDGGIQTGPFGSILHKDEYQDTGTPIVNPVHLVANRICRDDIPRIGEQAAERLRRYRLKQNDLLFARRGDIGRHGIVHGDEAGWVCGTGCFIVRVSDPRVDPRYLNEFVSTDSVIDWLKRHAAGVIMPNLSNRVLERLPVCFPPRQEQAAITRVLSAVQRAIERQERLIALTTELKKALMHRLFTEGTRGEPRKQTEIGPVPESWDIVALGSIAKIGNGSTPKRDNVAYWKDGTIPWLTSGKIHEGRITQPDQYVTEAAKAECHLPLVAAGSLLVAITGEGKTLGNAALVEFDTCVSQHLAYVQFHRTDVVPAFLLYFLQRQYAHLRQMSVGAGSTKGALTCGLLKRYAVPVPKNDEQLTIAEAIDTAVAKMRGHERTAECLRCLFRTLLDQLMTAQIRVHDLDLSALAVDSGEAELQEVA